MKKIIFQLLILSGVFLACWFLLSNIDWRNIFGTEEMSENTEKKLGDIYWDYFDSHEQIVKDPYVTKCMDSLLIRISTSNAIDKEKIKLHVVESDEVNAFALPDNHLVVYTGLIKECSDETELCGVMCHEIAHLELNHIMRKLVKEVGLSMLISMAGGNSSSEIIREAVKLLSSSAYDRKLEKEADINAVDYLIKADINPEGFANFLYTLSLDKTSVEKSVNWINTHPDSEERSKYILDKAKNSKIKYMQVLKNDTWDELKEKCYED
ncbi:MAG: M48 family metallopeptidase [Bacteroidia bacterium]|nr:M48 family metallopeptidase [Bacteroidia bacterium]MBP7259762.1 M48 family metallopeptidase [Bacteroidia bacterium]MBP9180814.1 M48 family metallopeptidase [Bacteroidia bacterium]MBP9723287.1 M48 family metallopeptidase [Bacteroidia bacterium]